MQANDDDNSSDDGDPGAAYLSDEEQLDSEADGADLLASLRRGAFPPEVSVLYSLCLIHEGGRNFIAKKCMNSINHLEQESGAWVTEAVLSPGLSKSLSWYLCRATAMEPLGRTAAYAFVAENLHQANKEADWADHFAPMFAVFTGRLLNTGLIQALHDSQGEQTPSVQFRRGLIEKCIHAWGRLEVIRASKVYCKASTLRDEAMHAKESIIRIFILLMKYLYTSNLKSPLVDSDGSASESFSQVRSVTLDFATCTPAMHNSCSYLKCCNLPVKSSCSFCTKDMICYRENLMMAWN